MEKKIYLRQGQALIELIIFLPLMITLYSVIGGFASAINGSINQQKIARSYFYYRIQNNSTIPGAKANSQFMSWKSMGMFYTGWKDKFESGNQPVMPCYKISIPFRDDPTDQCEDAYSQAQTLWVRVGTVYGLCGATYVKENNQVYQAPDANGLLFKRLVDQSSCLISE